MGTLPLPPTSKKPIFRQPKSLISIVIIPSARIGHSADKALFSPELITPVVVSSLLSTLAWPSLLFLSPLFLPRIPTQTTPVLKFFFPTTLPYNSLTSTPLSSAALLLTLAPGPSILTSFQNFPDTFILRDCNAHHPAWDRFIPPNPPGNDLFRWITSSGLEILNDPASPTLLHHSTGRRSSPDISLAPASLAPTVSGALSLALALTISPLRLSSPSLQFVIPTLVPPNSTTKRPVGMFTNHTLLSTSPFLILMQSTSTRLPAPFPSSKSKLPQLLSPLAALVVLPKPGGPRKRNLQCGDDAEPAPRHTDLRLTASDT